MSAGLHDISFLKGHGTENDFVLVPDEDGELLDRLGEDGFARLAAALCDRRAGIGADGVIRVVRADAYLDAASVAARGRAEWFMDYRNADGSTSEMCGNGVRVLARHLLDNGATSPLTVGTRAGLRTLVAEGDQVTADMGHPRILGETTVVVAGRRLPAQHVSMGNPHAVAFVADLAEAGSLLEAPGHDPQTFPRGANVEFVVRRARRHVAMRVHERGSRETRSCGTGACAVMVTAALADGCSRGGEQESYRVDVPGGTLHVTWTEDDRVLLTGPAVLVASGTWTGPVPGGPAAARPAAAAATGR